MKQRADCSHSTTLLEKQSNPGEKQVISSTKTQFTVDLPLKIETYYDSFPYRLVGASVLIELTARVEKDPHDETQEIKYYPDLLRSLGPGGLKHILCMRPENFKDLNDMETYNVVEMSPSLMMVWHKKRKHTEKLKVTFYLEEPAVTKLFKFLMPMVLIAFLTTLNVLVGLDGGVQDENAGSNFEYLALASGIALATIVLLPEMQQISACTASRGITSISC